MKEVACAIIDLTCVIAKHYKENPNVLKKFDDDTIISRVMQTFDKYFSEKPLAIKTFDELGNGLLVKEFEKLSK